jgi:hypothetical protein
MIGAVPPREALRQPRSQPMGLLADLLRYKWMILAAVLVSLAMGTVIALSTTPIFEAVGRIVINREGADAAGLKSAETSADSDDDYMVSVDTQTHVLQSDAIAKLVIFQAESRLRSGLRRQGRHGSQPNRVFHRRRMPRKSSRIVKRAWSPRSIMRLQISSIPGPACWKFVFPAPIPSGCEGSQYGD